MQPVLQTYRVISHPANAEIQLFFAEIPELSKVLAFQLRVCLNIALHASHVPGILPY